MLSLKCRRQWQWLCFCLFELKKSYLCHIVQGTQNKFSTMGILQAFCKHFASILQAFCKHFANIFQVFCKHFASILQAFCKICKHFACILQAFCKHFASILQAFCEHFASILRTFCEHFASILQAFLKASLRAFLKLRQCNCVLSLESKRSLTCHSNAHSFGKMI